MLNSAEFAAFLESGTERLSFILDYFERHGVRAVVMPVDGKNHIYVVFPKESYDAHSRIKTVIAHYDIFPGSIGANDNSAAVFSLMQFAVRLNNSKTCHNIRLIFTDGEELAEQSGVKDQGAFNLAFLFRKLGITDDAVFVFDCTGRGTVPVIASTEFSQKTPESLRQSYESLRQNTENMLRSASGGKLVTVPVSYSDNAGFLACGIPAVLITFLPQNEAAFYLKNLIDEPLLKDFVQNRALPSNTDTERLKSLLPYTWSLFHSQKDSIQTLDEQSFLLMEKILLELELMKC